MANFVERVLRAGEGRRMKELEKQVTEITALEPEISVLSRRAAARQDDSSSGSGWPRARRSTTCSTRPSPWPARPRSACSACGPFDVQLMGGIVLHDGDIAEMKTGEGKTLVAVMPMYLNALAGKGAHLVTVNDYLARRDAEWMGDIYRFLGLEVGVIQAMMDARGAPRRLQRRHHLRHQQRVRLRLPARQHGDAPRRVRAARPLLLHRRRGRLASSSTRRARR